MQVGDIGAYYVEVYSNVKLALESPSQMGIQLTFGKIAGYKEEKRFQRILKQGCNLTQSVS